MRNHAANCRRWREKKGKYDLTPGWWWCRLRIHPDCQVMTPVDYRSAPRPKACPVCREFSTRTYAKKAAKAQACREWRAQVRATREIAKQTRRKCAVEGCKRPVWHGRNGDKFMLLCRECYHDGESRHDCGQSFLSRTDWDRAERKIAAAKANADAQVRIYTREEILQYAKESQA